jgi:biotin-(acetyl-CoA carboxylase) ligase
VLAAVESRTLFPCENWVSSWKNTSFKSQISRWRKANFVQNRPVQLSWRNKCISQRTWFIVEAEASGTFSPCENWVSFGKKSFHYLGFSSWS